MITEEYQRKYLLAIEAKEALYSSCRTLVDGHALKETTAIRDAACVFFELFISGPANGKKTGSKRKPETSSMARKMADLFVENLILRSQLKDICLMSPESIRCVMDAALLRIVHPEVEAYCYDVAGAVRFEGISGKQKTAASIAPSLITDAIIGPSSIEINSIIYVIKIKFESATFLLDELFSALLLGRVKSIVHRKRAESEKFANMIESLVIERQD